MHLNRREDRQSADRGVGPRLMSIGIIAILAGVPIIIYLQIGSRRPSWQFAALVAVVAGLLMVPVFRWAFHFDRRERSLDRHKYWICSQCEYPLDSLSESGRCPECGTSYTYRELQEYWIERQARESGERPNPYREKS